MFVLPLLHVVRLQVVNQTEPLSGSESVFSSIWYPTLTYSANDMFITASSYDLLANLSSTTVTFEISETSYYIRNIQSPIAKQPEVIFRTLLFAFLCLEICAMAFLIGKLLLIPLCRKLSILVVRKYGKRWEQTVISVWDHK